MTGRQVPLFGAASRTTYDPRKHYRRGNPEPARDAARFQAEGDRWSESCRVVLDALRSAGPRGLTDAEGAERTGLFSYRRRRADLVAADMVRSTGDTRPSPRGRPMTVYQLVPGAEW